MGISENFPIVELDINDVDAGLNLSDEANWNQIGDDWRLFIQHGKTIGLRDQDGKLIASAAALPYESTLGFIAMVLVTKEWRRRGFASRLVNACIEWLQKQQLIPVLDATSDGAKVYRHQGFNPMFELDRWQFGASANQLNNKEQAPGIPGSGPQIEDIQKLAHFDADVMGAQRAFLINNFHARNDTQTIILPDGNGFGMIRRGRRALQIGPLVASSQAEAIDLLEQILGTTDEAVFIDVPTMATQVSQYLINRGFTKQRSFWRMALGRKQPFGAPHRLFASAGPEFG